MACFASATLAARIMLCLLLAGTVEAGCDLILVDGATVAQTDRMGTYKISGGGKLSPEGRWIIPSYASEQDRSETNQASEVTRHELETAKLQVPLA